MKPTLCLLVFAFLGLAHAADSVSPSPSPTAGKSVSTQVSPDEPSAIGVTGVRAADPSQNGRVNTGSAPSLSNTSSMGAGITINLGGAPKQEEKDVDSRDNDKN